MNNIEWKENAVCYAAGNQRVYTSERLDEDLFAHGLYPHNFKDFQLNEIRTGDYIPASELDTEQKYNEVVEVFGLFGFHNNSLTGYKGLSSGEYDNLVIRGNGFSNVVINFDCKRQLTYNQLMAIGKLKRMMLEGESIERQSSYCRCKQVAPGESKLPKFNVETPIPEVKEPKKHKPVVAQVMVDLMERMEVGIKTYGEALRPNNGRDALQDAYEEALDLACYLKQAMIERDQAND